jgi:hypothetical protein
MANSPWRTIAATLIMAAWRWGDDYAERSIR